MTHYALQINFELNVKPEVYLSACEHVVNAVADVPQLEWKLWILSDDGKRAGGWYLFRDRAAAEAYADGPIIGRLRESGMPRNMELRVFEAVESLTGRTGARVLPAPDRASSLTGTVSARGRMGG
jgi:hypothetical protein